MAARRGPGRPQVVSVESIEAAAIELFLAKGYEKTTINDIIVAAGVSRTTFFRYYAAKSDVLWKPFDEHLARLAENLRASPTSGELVSTMVDTIVATFAHDIDDDGVWLRRFQLQEQAERGAAGSLHWHMWADVISVFLRERLPISSQSIVPEAIGGAIQGALLAFIRRQDLSASTDRASTLTAFRTRLDRMSPALAAWLAEEDA